MACFYVYKRVACRIDIDTRETVWKSFKYPGEVHGGRIRFRREATDDQVFAAMFTLFFHIRTLFTFGGVFMRAKYRTDFEILLLFVFVGDN